MRLVYKVSSRGAVLPERIAMMLSHLFFRNQNICSLHNPVDININVFKLLKIQSSLNRMQENQRKQKEQWKQTVSRHIDSSTHLTFKKTFHLKRCRFKLLMKRQQTSFKMKSFSCFNQYICWLMHLFRSIFFQLVRLATLILCCGRKAVSRRFWS